MKRFTLLLICLALIFVSDISTAYEIPDDRKPIPIKKHKERKILYDASLEQYSDDVRIIIIEQLTKANPNLDIETADRYVEYIFEATYKYGGLVHPFEVSCVIVKESTVNKEAKNKGAYGLMQIVWRIHKPWIQGQHPQIKDLEDFMDPKNNIMAGTMILTKKKEKYKNNIYVALKSYNGSEKKEVYATSVVKRIDGLFAKLKNKK
jgi:hypothetical protein